MAPSTNTNSITDAEPSTEALSTNVNGSINTEPATNANSSTDIIPFTITEPTIDIESTISTGSSPNTESSTETDPNMPELEDELDLRMHYVLSLLPGDYLTHPPTTQDALINSIKQLVEAMTEHHLPNDHVHLAIDYLFLNFHCFKLPRARLAIDGAMYTGWSTHLPDNWSWNVTNVIMRR